MAGQTTDATAQATTESGAAAQSAAAGAATSEAGTPQPTGGTPAAQGGAQTAAEGGQQPAANASTAPASDGAQAGQSADSGQQQAESKVPERYTFTVPEGGAAFVDDAVLQRLEQIARASGWSQEDAQAALEEHVVTMQALAEEYRAQAMADPEYGGDRFNETQRLARKVIDRVRPAGHPRHESFLRFLARGGAGNHIEVLSFLADLGALMGEDAPPRGRAAAAGVVDAATKLYDHPTSQAAG